MSAAGEVTEGPPAVLAGVGAADAGATAAVPARSDSGPCILIPVRKVKSAQMYARVQGFQAATVVPGQTRALVSADACCALQQHNSQCVCN